MILVRKQNTQALDRKKNWNKSLFNGTQAFQAKERALKDMQTEYSDRKYKKKVTIPKPIATPTWIVISHPP